MALMKTWYTPEEIEEQMGVTSGRLLQWVDEGLVRAERTGKKVARVNIDDVKLAVESAIRRG